MDEMDDCYFTSFLTVFESYQDDWKVIMRGCVQWNLVYSWKKNPSIANPGLVDQ